MSERQIVVVGGGISGLSAAYHLLKIAERKSIRLKVTLVERESWWGGKIRTVTEDGFTVEGGPDNFVTVKPWALELCSELGLTERLLPTNQKARRVFILWRGKLHLLPHGFLTFSPDLKGLLETSLLSWQSKLRVALGV
ncbi:MAG: FAD-dependent oxidoreductase, partial [Armatimonadota bacterium]|nr:FAD-dependent oxidoreductase [Armatimonadota bacterium]